MSSRLTCQGFTGHAISRSVMRNEIGRFRWRAITPSPTRAAPASTSRRARGRSSARRTLCQRSRTDQLATGSRAPERAERVQPGALGVAFRVRRARPRRGRDREADEHAVGADQRARDALHVRARVVATPHRDARQLEAALLRAGTEIDRDDRVRRRAVLLDEARDELAIVVAVGAGEEEGFVTDGACQRRDAAHAQRATGTMP